MGPGSLINLCTTDIIFSWHHIILHKQTFSGFWVYREPRKKHFSNLYHSLKKFCEISIKWMIHFYLFVIFLKICQQSCVHFMEFFFIFFVLNIKRICRIRLSSVVMSWCTIYDTNLIFFYFKILYILLISVSNLLIFMYFYIHVFLNFYIFFSNFYFLIFQIYLFFISILCLYLCRPVCCLFCVLNNKPTHIQHLTHLVMAINHVIPPRQLVNSPLEKWLNICFLLFMTKTYFHEMTKISPHLN